MTDDLAQPREFQAYLRARDAVLRMKGMAPADASAPSAYWAEELDNIDYMIEASPLVVRKLRHHAFHITGIRPYDYREKHDGRRQQFEGRLRALRAIGGDGLLVPESPVLGGYGYDIDGRLFNVDTIKFYEVLIGMERGGVLGAIRGTPPHRASVRGVDPGDRPLVCEIGGGWGGFAYQFKTLFPRATYVIVDFPELFLFSATYLATVFPQARIVFAGTDDAAAIEGWRDADVVFVPHTRSRLVSALPLDLTVNMVSFQEMTDTQVRGYAAMAAAAGCPLLYSMNRERSLYNAELVSVSHALAESYTLTEVSVLETDYTSTFKNPPKTPRLPAVAPAKAGPADPSEPRYRHLVGRLNAAAHRRAPSSVQPRPGVGAAGPRVVLGMTLYNNARYLPSAIESLLAQTHGDFGLLLLDDASTDGTEEVAKGFVERDGRVRYLRHATRQAMIATWREVAETAARQWPSAEYFAWVSDHDWWHPRWLERMIAELDADAGAVLAYPITRRVTSAGEEIDKGARLFDTAADSDLRARWRRFCREGVGAGDMVYGLVRLDALRAASVFRPVLRPDRLLIAELTLQGRIRQVPEVLWFRRQSSGASVDRQTTTLMLPGAEPRWFSWPPWAQHTMVLWREYAARQDRAPCLTRARWIRMLAHYQVCYGWRHFRKTAASHAVGRGVDRVLWARKMVKHHYHHAVYHTLIGSRVALARLRRLTRRGMYEALMLTHRLGLRGRSEL
ncbi:MAG: putative sugar O-methyltransferase [Acidobacteria bacterium]|nr:putative sugar O-methyltransferase [Acidobacteriota bacterium]